MTRDEQTEATRTHYDRLLAEHYSWMSGNFDDQVTQTQQWFDECQLPESNGTKALDLGCGPGIQTIALAQRGFKVQAIDFNEALLAELNQRASGLPVETTLADLTQLRPVVAKQSFEVIVCMGDTLPHLPSVQAVQNLFQLCSEILPPDGWLLLSFREQMQELEGTDRIIPVRLEREKLMLTFLEYLPETLQVHDIVLSQTNTGDWQLQKSAYPKLRLSAEQVIRMGQTVGLSCTHQHTEKGFTKLVWRRSSP